MNATRQTVLGSGVPNLDLLLGGGVPEGDLLLVVGAPGSGKTTLMFQMACHNAAAGRPVVYVSTLSEPSARLLKHIRGFTFWDERMVGKRLFLESIFPVVKEGVAPLTDALVETVKAHRAELLVVDGFMTIRDLHPQSMELRTFVSELGVAMAPLGCTTILTSSDIPDMRSGTPAEFTMCDGILELTQQDVGPRTVRLIRAWKVRGAPSMLGNHSLHITDAGLATYPRIESQEAPAPASFGRDRLSFGIPEVDELMRGGLPQGSVTILGGAPGTGKTVAALQFVMEGSRRSEKSCFVGFRESRRQLSHKSSAFDLGLDDAVEAGSVSVLRRAPVELDPDRFFSELWTEIDRLGARRLVIDSLVELQTSIVDERRRRGVMSAFTEGLRARGVTALLNLELAGVVGPELDFANSPLEVLGENVLLLRYVEFEHELARILSVLKMRDSAHDHSIRQYDIGQGGLRVLPRDQTAKGLLRGIAHLTSERRIKRHESGSPDERKRDEDGDDNPGDPT